MARTILEKPVESDGSRKVSLMLKATQPPGFEVEGLRERALWDVTEPERGHRGQAVDLPFVDILARLQIIDRSAQIPGPCNHVVTVKIGWLLDIGE